jgi:membrane-bound lytic murein transglycosylase D
MGPGTAEWAGVTDGASTAVVSLPVHVNDDVDRWAARFRHDERAAFQRLLERQGVYAELIRGSLRERGMPEELQYLAMMESGFSNRAESEASAVGLWQFMEGTAVQFGLRVDDWVDERRDPVRSTDAALDYLAWLHERYGSWYLAAAAYNAGPGKIDWALRNHARGRRGDEALYWEILPHLPRETQQYVPRLLAAVLVGERAGAEGFEASSADPYRYERVFVPGGTSLARVAWILGVEARALHALNRHLVQGATPPGETYPLRVPPGLSDRVVSALRPRSRS